MINKYSDVPIYCQLKSMILKKIEAGEFKENNKIPSEQEFCEKYGISRPTVRQAIIELTNSGFLYKEKGKGTYVSKSKSRIDIKNYTGFADSLLDSQAPGQKDIISVKKVSSRENECISGVFNTASGQAADFAEVKYVTKNNADILSLNVSYLPLSFFPSFIEDINEKKPSYDILRGKYPFIPVKSKSSMEVIYTEQNDAQFLHVQTGQPLIMIESSLYSKSGQLVEYVISKYRADKCKLMFENSK